MPLTHCSEHLMHHAVWKKREIAPRTRSGPCGTWWTPCKAKSTSSLTPSFGSKKSNGSCVHCLTPAPSLPSLPPLSSLSSLHSRLYALLPASPPCILLPPLSSLNSPPPLSSLQSPSNRARGDGRAVTCISNHQTVMKLSHVCPVLNLRMRTHA